MANTWFILGCVLAVVSAASLGAASAQASSAQACLARDYGRGSVVCVCNATYCDSPEPNTKLAKGKIAQYLSTKDGKRLEKSVFTFSPKTLKKSDDIVFTIVRNKTYQTIIGFGGAFTDSTGINIMSLSQKTQDNLIKSYFGPDGSEYNVGRIPIASCDFSPRVYSYDDTPGDLELKNFKLQDEDFKYKIPVIKKALELSGGDVKLFGSPWSSPGWMKTNGKMVGGGYLIGQPGGKYYKAWANYFVRFLQEYQKQNITMWGLTAENEPVEGTNPDYTFQCLGFTPELQRDFIALDLGPALHKAGFQDVKLMIMDDQRDSLPAWPKTVLLSNSSSAAAKYVSGIALHWYVDFSVPPIVLDQTHDALPQYFMFATEACNYAPVMLGFWERMEAYVHDIIEDLSHWVGGWTDWNMVLDLGGGPTWVHNNLDAAIIANATADEFLKQPTYYGLAHFSKFVKPESLRIDVQVSGTTSLDTLAFLRADGATILIVYNHKDTDETFTISDPQFGVARFSAPRRSIQTLCWWF